jgi:hypothetical protein
MNISKIDLDKWYPNPDMGSGLIESAIVGSGTMAWTGWVIREDLR